MTFDVTALYKGWVEGSIPNHGVAFQLEQPICANGDIIWLFSSDYADDTGLRPKLVVTTQSECVHQPPDMVSWWDAENNANDIIGSNDGTLMNGATFAPGKVGQAFSFDGVDDYVAIPHSSSLDLNSAFTLGAWIKVSDFTNAHATIISEGDFTWRLQRSFSSNTLLFGTGDWNTGPWNDLTGTTAVNDGQWHYVAAVFGWQHKISVC
jgi:hypothetical protein